MYHAVVRQPQRDAPELTVPLELFEEQMRFLKENGYRVLPVSRLVSWILGGEALPPKSVCLTFDDGHRSLPALAFPVLERLRFPAAAFLVVEPADPETRVGWDEARRMRTAGLLEIGCHGLTHRILRGLPPEELEREIAHAKRVMEDRLGAEVPWFAYPFGSFGSWDRRVLPVLDRADFKAAFTSVFGLNTRAFHPFLLRRCRVSWRQQIPDFKMLLEGAYDWYAGLQRLQRLS